MAPIPPLSPAIGSLPPLVAAPWLMWTLLAILAIVMVSLSVLSLVWVYKKANKSIATFIQRIHERKLVLPTHLDPRMTRPIVLPLPQNFFVSTTPIVNPESLSVNVDNIVIAPILEKAPPLLWLSTSLDCIAVTHEEFTDEAEAPDTPALSPSLDTDDDSDDSSLRTPPASLFTQDFNVVDDNSKPAAGCLGVLTSSTAFSDFLDLSDSSDESFETLDSSLSVGNALYCNTDVPTIVITEDLDDTGPHYDYESPGLVSTPSTAALYTLGLPITAHEYPPQGPSPAPIPIPFSPTLSADSYICVPPPGSPEYFYCSESTPVDDDEEPDIHEEASLDLSHFGLDTWSTGDTWDLHMASGDRRAFEWDLLLEREAELEEARVEGELCSAFSTDSDLASDEDDCDDDDSSSDDEPQPEVSRLGLRSTSGNGNGNAVSECGGTFD